MGPTGKEFCKNGHRLAETRVRQGNGRTKCLACYKAYHQTYRRDNPAKYAHYKRKQHLKQRYGLSLEEYDNRLLAQNHLCAICNIHLQTEGRFAVVDHNHITGQVRDILCQQCNAGIGLLGDNKELIKAAVAYLERHSDGV